MQHQPKPGTIINCNFDGYISPEMVKRRPVIILKRNKLHNKLVTIVPISTTAPRKITNLHIEIEGPVDGKQAWIKCDMIYTVCLDRLSRLKEKDKDGLYQWVNKTLDDQQFDAVKKGVANYLSLNNNTQVP